MVAFLLLDKRFLCQNNRATKTPHNYSITWLWYSLFSTIDNFQWVSTVIVSNMASVLWAASTAKRWTCCLQLYRRQLSELAVSHHSHKIVVLSGLGRLVSEHNNNSFPSVNSSLWGLYCIQLRLCQICGECEAFDCRKLVCYCCINKFMLVFVLKEGQTTSRPILILIGWLGI